MCPSLHQLAAERYPFSKIVPKENTWNGSIIRIRLILIVIGPDYWGKKEVKADECLLMEPYMIGIIKDQAESFTKCLKVCCSHSCIAT